MAEINLNDLQKRKLNNSYIVWYLVKKDLKLRNAVCIETKPLYVLWAVDNLGNRQIIGMYFEKKDNRFWLEIFEDLKARGTENVMFLVTPTNKNIERCIKLVYNYVKIVKSPMDTIAIITRYFAEKPSRSMKTSFKNLFLAKDLDKFKIDLSLFKERYLNNKVVLMLLERKEPEIEKFYEYSYEIRRLLYPYYTIREMLKFLNKLNNLEELCTNINEVIEYSLEYINSFEKGRSYYKQEWLQVLSILYEKYTKEMEEYL